ncbi:MAG: hypothetical protein ACD_10C00115G0002 [uncultured bacterium]|nr:MAG: hypothetical protein ACD_10C00115G0002 [uncultured bacterium]
MKNQRGATLLVALIMLVLMTLAVVMSFNAGRNNAAIIGNQQAQQATTDTARAALEEVISHTFFTDSPSTSFGTANDKGYDINSDSTPDITVAMTPKPCIRNYTILPVDPDDTASQGCVSGAQQNLGVEGAAKSGASCADVIWELTAVATDTVTEARTTAIQGVRVRQDANAVVNTANHCPSTQ